MNRRSFLVAAAALGIAASPPLAGRAAADELRVVSSGGFSAAYRVLVPEFERQSGTHVVTEWGPSMGNTPQAVPARLKRGEPIDVVIMVGYALDDLVKEGKVAPGSGVELARSGIAMAVRAGAPKPDISTPEALKAALLAAKSVAYSDSASGVYISTGMFQRLGIAEAMAGKARMIPATPVGEIVAQGEAELGFQQLSELKPVAGIDVVGLLPAPVQKLTVFSAGIVAGSKQPEAAKALVAFLASPTAAQAIRDSGMEPIGSGGK